MRCKNIQRFARFFAFLLHEKLHDKPLDATLYVEQKVFVSIFSHHFHMTKIFQQHVDQALSQCRTHFLYEAKVTT